MPRKEDRQQGRARMSAARDVDVGRQPSVLRVVCGDTCHNLLQKQKKILDSVQSTLPMSANLLYFQFNDSTAII